MIYYTLKENTPVLSNLQEWATWMESGAADEASVIERTDIGGIVVSTVFLGVTQNKFFPKLFETALFLFDGEEVDVVRYETRDEAAEGHKVKVKEIKDMYMTNGFLSRLMNPCKATL